MNRDSRNAIVTTVAIIGAVLGALACLGGDSMLSRLYGPTTWAGGLLADKLNLASFACFGAAILMLVERAVFVARQREVPAIAALSGDDESLLTPDDVKAARQQFVSLSPPQRGSLHARLLEAGLQRARAHWSAEDVSNAVKTEAELVQTQSYADYSMIRFLVWSIPTLGFIGTVVGISLAMGLLSGPPTPLRAAEPPTAAVAKVDDDAKDDVADANKDAPGPNADAADGDEAAPTPATASRDEEPATESGPEPATRDIEMAGAQRALAMAFNTTFVALVLSLIVMFVLHRVESWEDSLLVNATRGVLRRLPLRMYIRQERTT